jgi:hypothetical protein
MTNNNTKTIYSSIEIDAQKKNIRQNFGMNVDLQYLSELWKLLHKMRGYVSYQL